MISLGFCFKSYVGHRFRLRRQRVVAQQNDLMLQLLQEALPPDMAIEESPEGRGKYRYLSLAGHSGIGRKEQRIPRVRYPTVVQTEAERRRREA